MRAPPWTHSRDCRWPLEGIPPVGPSTADISAVSDARDKVRRVAGWALVGGLSVAALTAIAALLAGDRERRGGLGRHSAPARRWPAARPRHRHRRARRRLVRAAL